MRFSKKADIDGLAIPPRKPDGRPTEVVYRDDQTPGFAVRVTSGGSKTYIAQKRVKGRQRRVTIARCTDIPLDKARRIAQGELGKMALGEDPARVRSVGASARDITLGEVFTEYLRARELRASTIRGYEQVMRNVFGDWHKRPLARISKDMVETRYRTLGERSRSQANLAMRVLRALFNFANGRYEDADGKSLFPDNPVKRLSNTKAWFPTKRRDTVITASDLPKWMNAVLALGNVPCRDAKSGKWLAVPKNASHCRDYFLLLLFSGLRKTEALNLMWRDVDLTQRTLTVPETKNHQAHTLPLSDPMWEILNRRRGSVLGEYVFSTQGGKRLQNTRNAQAWVSAASGVPFTLHDLRRTFSTAGQSIGLDWYTLKRLMNHKISNDVTAGYIILNAERLRAPIQLIADYLLGLCSNTVRPFPARLGAT